MDQKVMRQRFNGWMFRDFALRERALARVVIANRTTSAESSAITLGWHIGNKRTEKETARQAMIGQEVSHQESVTELGVNPVSITTILESTEN
eukprot:5964023-Amphidinium_carterae.2